jgi:hypothetical protein
LGLLGSKYYQNEERSKTNPLVYGRKRENQWYQSYQGSNVRHLFIISLIILSDLSTIQLAFKDKGHKSLEYCCLVIHLTSIISTISNAESNGGIFILIAPLGITKHYETYCEWFVNNTYCERFVNKYNLTNFAWFSKAINR